jgi:MFS family permease
LPPYAQPDSLQDYVVNWSIAAFTGGLLLGFALLQSLGWWLAFLLALVMAIILSVWALRHFLRHRRKLMEDAKNPRNKFKVRPRAQ